MFRFFRWFKIGPLKLGVSNRGIRRIKIGPVKLGLDNRGISAIKVGRFSKSRGRSVRVSVPTGVKGLRFSLGGKRKRRP